MTLVFLMLSVAVRRGCLKRNSLDLGKEGELCAQAAEKLQELSSSCGSTHLGGMFSGRLDQSQIQSAFFLSSRSTSLLLSRKSSSDCNQEPPALSTEQGMTAATPRPGQP